MSDKESKEVCFLTYYRPDIYCRTIALYYTDTNFVV